MNENYTFLNVSMEKIKESTYLFNTLMITKVVFTKMQVGETFILFNSYQSIIMIQVTWNFAVKKDATVNSYDKILFHHQLNLCKFINGAFNFMVKMALEVVKKYANFIFACPFPIANHTMTNFPVTESFFPPILPTLHFRMFMYLSAQVPGIKSMKEIYNLVITGELER